jgi:hypothetical protein
MLHFIQLSYLMVFMQLLVICAQAQNDNVIQNIENVKKDLILLNEQIVITKKNYFAMLDKGLVYNNLTDFTRRNSEEYSVASREISKFTMLTLQANLFTVEDIPMLVKYIGCFRPHGGATNTDTPACIVLSTLGDKAIDACFEKFKSGRYNMFEVSHLSSVIGGADDTKYNKFIDELGIDNPLIKDGVIKKRYK